MAVEELEDRRSAQRAEALVRANRVRTARARMKRRLAVGLEDARELLLSPPPDLETVELEEFLKWCPKIGKVKAGRIIRKVQLHPSVKLRSLSERTRKQIASMLP